MASAGSAPQTEDRGEPEITADELRTIARALALVQIPDHLVDKVLEHVRGHRASMRKLEQSGIDLAEVITAQPFRA